MIEAKHRSFQTTKLLQIFFITEYTGWLNNNIITNKQISRENTDFPKPLVQLRIGSGYVVPIDRIEGLVRFNPLAQSKWEKAIITLPVRLYPLAEALIMHYWYGLIRTLGSCFMCTNAEIFSLYIINNEVNSPEQFGAGAESLPSGWQTTTSSSSVTYPSIQEYVYVSRYDRFRSAGTTSVKVPFSGTGHVIAVMKNRHFFVHYCLSVVRLWLNIVIATGEWSCFNGRHNTQ